MSLDISLEKLVEVGAHFGHQTRRWDPKMAPYIYGEENGVHVFDLIKTKALLEEALEFLKKTASNGGTILLVGTKKQAQEKIVEVGQKTGCPYVSQRWLGGTLTNFNQLARSIMKLTDMKSKMAEGVYNKFTKKERLLIEREIDRMEKLFGGMLNLQDFPDVLFIVDTRKETGAIKEAQLLGVKTVGIVDSNSDPTLVTYPISMNDDGAKAIEYVLELVEGAIMEGKRTYKKHKTTDQSG